MTGKRSDRAILATLAADPDRIANVLADDLPELIGQAEALRARLFARLVSTATAPAERARTERTNGPDRLLTAKEAAARLGVNQRWMYAKADSLPFTRRLSAGTLRFSERGLDRWRESRA
jgi:predicted DNA-binding transcriptional regulator AlpA